MDVDDLLESEIPENPTPQPTPPTEGEGEDEGDGEVTPPTTEPVDYGVIGYVTLDEANMYMTEHYMSTETVRVSWEMLSDDDKAALLRRSFQSIELLPYTGHKTCIEQKTAFPRCPSTEVPEPVKWAQIEQASFSSDTEENEDAKHYEKLWQWGVQHYTIGNLSETISAGTYGAGALRTAGVTSATAARLLAPYIQGGFNIR